MGFFLFFQLCGIELVVVAFLLHELFVATAFGDALIRDVEDAVTIFDGGQAVRDNEACSALQKCLQALLQEALGLGIDGRRGFVQHEDLRVGEQRSCKRDELLLALRETRAALVYLRVVAVRHFADKLMRAHGLCGGDDLLIRGIQAAVADVIHDGAGENEAVLQHNAHLRAQRVQRHLGDVVPIDEHPAGIDVIKARDEVDDRRFAGACGADERDGLARLYIEIEVLQNVDGTVIGERHVVERHIALDRRQLRCIRCVIDEDRFIDHLEDTLQIRHGVDERIVEVGKLQNRLPEAPRIRGNGNERTDLHGGAQKREAHKIHGADHPCGDVIDGEPHEVGGVLRLHPAFVHFGVEVVVDLRVFLFTRERLRDLHAVEALVQVGVQVGALIGNVLPGAALCGLDDKHDDEEQRDARHDDERKLDIAHKHEHGDENEVEDFKNEIDDAVRKRVRNGVNVVDDARQNFAVRAVVIELERKPLQMLKEVLADVVDDGLPHHRHVARALDGKENGKQNG